MRYSVLGVLLILLTATACGEEKKDYDAVAHCQGVGHVSGTPEFEKCIKEQKTQRLMEQQRREYEQMRRDREDDKMMRRRY